MPSFPLARHTFAPQFDSIADHLRAAINGHSLEAGQSATHIEFTADASLATLAWDPTWQPVLTSLQSAIGEGLEYGDVSIWAVLTHRGIEIEFADETPGDDRLAYRAFSRCQPDGRGELPRALQTLKLAADWQLYRARCPQGGQAWTLVLPLRRAAVKVA